MVWVCHHEERWSPKEPCPYCQGQGWKQRENGTRYTCGECNHGLRSRRLDGYEVPRQAVVGRVILYINDKGRRFVNYEATQLEPYRRQVISWGHGRNCVLYDSEAEAWTSIRERGWALDQVEQRERREAPR
jgi:hypothetical protein